jgi:hypothetical protein
MTLAAPASGGPRSCGRYQRSPRTRRPPVHARLVGIGRGMQEEAGCLFGPAWQALRDGQWRRLGLGWAAAGAVVVVAFAAHAAPPLVARLAVVRADQPLGIVLVRLPLSLVAPTDHLPVAVAAVLVAVAFGVGQMLLGWRRTALVGLAAHTLATLSAHRWLLLGAPLGVASQFLHMPDTGPSVAVLAVAGYAGVEYRTPWLIAALTLYQAVENMTFGGLTSREHAVGLLLGVAAGLIHRGARPGHRSTVVGR